jgi:alpha-N-acetylglucosamine transferase
MRPIVVLPYFVVVAFIWTWFGWHTFQHWISGENEISPVVVSMPSSTWRTPIHVSNLTHIVMPPMAIATLVTPAYCRSAYVWFKSLTAFIDNNSTSVCVLLLTLDYSFEHYPACDALIRIVQRASFCTLWVRIPEQRHTTHVRIGNPSWAVSFNKVIVLSMSMFERILFLDCDVVLLSNPVQTYLANTKPTDILVGVADQFDGCQRRDVMNGGLFVVKPSSLLYEQAQTMLRNPSCLSRIWKWSDQELLNCLCGMAGSKQPSVVACALWPAEYGAFVQSTSCPEYNVDNIHAVHFAGAGMKPWDIPKAKFHHVHPFVRLWWCFEVSENPREECKLLGSVMNKSL